MFIIRDKEEEEIIFQKILKLKQNFLKEKKTEYIVRDIY